MAHPPCRHSLRRATASIPLRLLATATLVGCLIVAADAHDVAAQEGDSSPDSALVQAYRRRLTVLPYATYTPQTDVQFGIGGGLQFKWPRAARDPRTRASYLATNLAYTTKGQWSVYQELSLYLPGNKWWLWERGTVAFFPLFFYGVGPETEKADTNLMDHRFIKLEAKAVRRLRGDFYAGVYYRLNSFFDVDWQFPARISSTLSGGYGGVSSGIGVSALIDSRNSATTPTRGSFILLDYLHQADWIGSDFNFDQVVLDARTYLPVRHGKDVIALNGYAMLNGDDVPIQMMAMESAWNTSLLARGIYLGRFRDRHQVMGQVDYRGHLKGRFGYVAFGSAGSVFGTEGHALGVRVVFTYGVGLRFNVNPVDPLNLRVVYTLSSFGEAGLSVGATEAF
jgi:hypothetical protein